MIRPYIAFARRFRAAIITLCLSMTSSYSEELFSISIEAAGTKGIGIGSQPGVNLLVVCDPNKIDMDLLGNAVLLAMSDADFSLDPPSADSYISMKLGDQWSTSKQILTDGDIKSYNEFMSSEGRSEEVSLPLEYSYRISYTGKYYVNSGKNLNIWLDTTLFKGRNDRDAEVYGGNYSGSYFRRQFVSRILDDVRSISECN